MPAANKLINNSPGPVVAQFQLALNQRNGTLLVQNNHLGGLLEQIIPIIQFGDARVMRIRVFYLRKYIRIVYTP